LASSGTRLPRTGSNRFLPPDPRVESPYRFTPQLATLVKTVSDSDDWLHEILPE